MYGKFNLSDRFINFNIFRLPENVYLYWKSWSIYFVNQVFGDTEFLRDTNGDGKTVIWYPQFKYYNFHKWTNNMYVYHFAIKRVSWLEKKKREWRQKGNECEDSCLRATYLQENSAQQNYFKPRRSKLRNQEKHPDQAVNHIHTENKR